MKKPIAHRWRASLLAMILFLTWHIPLSFSQAQFMRPLQQGEITLTSTENELYQGHLTSAWSSSVTLVEIGDITSFLENGILTFTIPGTSTTLNVTPETAASQNGSEYTWSGTDSESNFFSISRKGGYCAGYIQTNNEAWTILPLRVNISLLIKHNLSTLGGTDCVLLPGEGTPSVDNCADEYNTCAAVVDVLLFVTDAAVGQVQRGFADPNTTNMEVYVFNLQEMVNMAFARSDIPNKRVRFRWISHNPTYSSNADGIFVSNAFATDPLVGSILGSYRADLGVFIDFLGTDGDGIPVPWTIPNIGTAAGVADIGQFEDPGPTHRTAIVLAPFALAPRWTLAHELTHLFGALHNRSANVPCFDCGNDRNICAHGFRFNAGGADRRTIHARAAAGEVRIPNFSNPDVEFMGVATGQEGDNNTASNNARIIRNTGCLLADYESSPEFGVMITGGLPYLCGLNGNVNPQTFTATILPATPGFPGTPPYTIEWWWNTSGIFTYQSPDHFLGTNTQMTISSVLACDFFFLHIRVTGADGFVGTFTRKINTVLCSACNEEKLTSAAHSNSTDLQKFQIYPNPTSESLWLKADVEKEFTARLFISDAYGKVVRTAESLQLSQGLNHEIIPLGALPNGLYILRLEGADVA
jgi:hypothetical protein